jgi:hypothetical protein
MKNISIKGILVGFVVLILLDEIGGILLTLAIAGELSTSVRIAIQTDNLFLFECLSAH